MPSLRSLTGRFRGSADPSVSSSTEPQATGEKEANQNESTGHSKDNSVNYVAATVEEPAADAENQPGELTFAEDTAGGMGRHLGIFSCTFLV